ncbi:hypothetical protein BBO99_00009118 [Phytophthora kernoviae]|uniref:Tudor domain-containing protein n=1 Tax=Phytophthora kernoviae TaxID=325452 RepID=A0A3R7MS61_9STRA|nr:hypothetical protein JM18_009008 [Phytophthora kernoviae]RLN27397.1 hypothetical protein BBI17_009122 [Phytophthora kernoviae]RLN74071.1 hypothetical protein BBO99_00009118 [Phytophthora kernoviae]
MIHGRGTIERVYRDYFVADVHFDTGRYVRNVEFSGLRVLNPEDEKVDGVPKRGFVVGSLVSISHKGTKVRRRGKIILCRTDGTFDILVNEFGQAQTLKRIARSALALANVKSAVYREGARVMVLQRLAPELLSPDDEEDGGRDDDSDVAERDPPPTLKAKSPPMQKDSDDGFEPEYSRGDRVEARFGGQASYYPGTIERVHPNGACDISYDDGDEEERVAPRLIRALSRTIEARKPATTSKNKSGNDSDGYESDFFESD